MIARRRCLMVLSVLSGEKPVSEAIKEASISRPAYYQMETRVLNAMLAALDPRSAKRRGPRSQASTAHVEKLLKRIRDLEQDQRRKERLLLLTRKAVRPQLGLMTPRRARLRKRLRLRSTSSGSSSSRMLESTPMATCPSIPIRIGESMR
jgi:hypothetical protein